jgi:hypothetical protein
MLTVRKQNVSLLVQCAVALLRCRADEFGTSVLFARDGSLISRYLTMAARTRRPPPPATATAGAGRFVYNIIRENV